MFVKNIYLRLFFIFIFILPVDVNATFDEFSYTPVSIVELITVGGSYDAWKVEVSGVLYFNREATLLYISKEKYRILDDSSSVFVDSSNFDEEMREKFADASGKYVSVQGLFNDTKRIKNTAKSHSFGPAYRGVLSRIKTITVLED